MKRLFSLALTAATGLLFGSSLDARVTQVEDWWENPAVIGVNKETAHATQTPYPSESALMSDSEFFATPWVNSKSSLRQSLNGIWKFHYVGKPADRPKDFYLTDFNSSDWDDIPVPSCWAMLGYDTPIYVNADLPFNGNKLPAIVARNDNDGYDENPVGSYIRHFNIPQTWDGKQIFLNFEGIYSAAYVWVNGQFAGYSQAANTNHEFDITDLVKSGDNSLAVQVIKWSDGSMLEDQDMFRWGGIFRDVTLTAVPKTFIRDHYITWNAALPSYNSGALSLQVELDNRADASVSATVEAKLLDKDGKTVATFSPQSLSNFAAGTVCNVNMSVNLTDAALWSFEAPNLYTLVMTLKDASGKETEAISTKVGLRTIEIMNRFVYINGEKIFFKGVNRQDTHPMTGRTMSTDDLLKDVLMFKQFNINTVRTSHCPHQPKMYAMYDHFGIYVMDEADLETHALQGKIVNDPEWAPNYADREERMVLRDRNHPSVVLWSLGNESQNGSNFAVAREAIRQLDDRFVHYEGQQATGFPNSDFTSKMYPYERDVINMDNWNDDRPHFICEYAHAMGQSLGNFVDYWDYFENSKRTVGGCIWDWADQAIYHPQEIKNGTQAPGRLYTGYDFPGPHQGNFMSNGVVDAERHVTQKLIEVKKVHQWIKMSDFDGKKKQIAVKNTYNFIDLSQFSVNWSLSCDGIEVEHGSIDDFNLDPGKSGKLDIPYTTVIDSKTAEEYLLLVEFVLRNANDWADAGHVVAEEQFQVKERGPLPVIDIESLNADLVTTGNDPVKVSGKDFSYSFNGNGELISIRYKGHEYIYNNMGFKFDDFRWVENDAPYSGTPPASMASSTVDNQALLCNFIDGDASGAKAVRITSSCEKSGVVSFVTHYTIYADGTLDVSTSYTNYNTDMKRLGMSMSLTPELENVEYFARGPMSNYWDRKTASHAAIYHTTVTDMREHFVHPQSMGNREDLRYVKFTSPANPEFGLLIETEGQCSFSALHFAEEDYGAYNHDFQLQPRPEVVVHLDYRQQGLGNGSCGSKVWDRYNIPTNTELSHTLRITPMSGTAGGYAIPEGSAGAYLTGLSAQGFDYSAKSAPANLYEMLSKTLEFNNDADQILKATASANVEMSAWIDLNHNMQFEDNEALTRTADGWSLNIGADCPSGDYRMRIVLDTNTPKADGPIASGRVYDLNVKMISGLAAIPAQYVTPKGTLHAQGKAYVKAISSEGAKENLDYSVKKCPESVYNLLDNQIKAERGSSFTLKLSAYKAGPRSENNTYQDLRYNTAFIYVDWYNSGKFTEEAQYGQRVYGPNIPCNYDVVMDIEHKFAVPANANIGAARIRVIYQNAWIPMEGPETQSIKEGVAYDIPLTILAADINDNGELTSLPDRLTGIPEGFIHPEGKAYVRRIYTRDATENVDQSWSEHPGFYNMLDQAVKTKAGQKFTFRFIAYSLGNTDKVRQDLRYNHATIFIDWYGNGLFTRVNRVGGIIVNSEKTEGNYNSVMTFGQDFTVPSDVSDGSALMRIIYQNAWQPEPGPYSKDIVDGVVYDCRIDIGDYSSIDEIGAYSPHPDGIYDLQGRRLNKATHPGFYIIDGVKTLVK